LSVIYQFRGPNYLLQYNYEPVLLQITVGVKYVEYLLHVSNFQHPEINIMYLGNHFTLLSVYM